MKLYERYKIDLDQKVAGFIPMIKNTNKKNEQEENIRKIIRKKNEKKKGQNRTTKYIIQTVIIDRENETKKLTNKKNTKKIQLHHDKHEEDYVEVLSPYTGNNTTSKDGEINEDDKSILFIYLGAAGDFVYISNEFRELIDEDIESIEIEDLEGKISHIDGTMIEVDYGWNGINYYCFIDPKG